MSPAFGQVFYLMSLHLTGHEFAVVVQFGDIDGAEIEKQPHIFAARLISLSESVIQHSELFVMPTDLPAAMMQQPVLFIGIADTEDQDNRNESDGQT